MRSSPPGPKLIPVLAPSSFSSTTRCRPASSANAAADPRVTLALENGNAPVVAEGRAIVHVRDHSEDVVAAFRERYDWDIRTPLPGTGQSRALIEIGTTRWLMSGVAH